jgi:hypothetical protein
MGFQVTVRSFSSIDLSKPEYAFQQQQNQPEKSKVFFATTATTVSITRAVTFFPHTSVVK